MISVPTDAQPPGAGDPAADRAAVHVAGLRKRYGDVVAVADLDLTVRPGEFFTLLGPSGSGKTTLLRLIAGFERPDAGRIELGGREVTHVPPYARNVNTVFQDYALFPHMTVGAFRSRSAGSRPGARWKWCGCPGSATVSLSSCLVASASAWRWPGRS